MIPMLAQEVDLDFIKPVHGELRVIVPELLVQRAADRIKLICAEVFKVCVGDYFL